MKVLYQLPRFTIVANDFGFDNFPKSLGSSIACMLLYLYFKDFAFLGVLFFFLIWYFSSSNRLVLYLIEEADQFLVRYYSLLPFANSISIMKDNIVMCYTSGSVDSVFIFRVTLYNKSRKLIGHIPLQLNTTNIIIIETVIKIIEYKELHFPYDKNKDHFNPFIEIPMKYPKFPLLDSQDKTDG